MKKYLLLLLIVFALAGCGKQETAPETTAPETTVPETTAETAAETVAETAAETTEPENEIFTLIFTAEDREGNIWTEENFRGYKGIILNFWEPWCGPCVGEMPDLQKLYEDYKDKGLLIVGVYSTEDVEEDVDNVLESAGTSYPILRYSPDFDPLQTGYVPTTVLLTEEGHLLAQPFARSLDYDAWAEIAELMLE